MSAPVSVRGLVRGTRELQAALLDIDRRTNRATMWTAREAGRLARTEARRTAPTLRGAASNDRRTVSRKQARTGGLSVNPNAPVAGLLRASISSGKRLVQDGDSYAVRVAPRGNRVHLYSQKIEARAGYMAAGYQAAVNAMPAIAARAWARATRR